MKIFVTQSSNSGRQLRPPEIIVVGAARTGMLRHLGRVLIDEGRPDDARRCLARVLHYEPASAKAYYRYLNTFITARGGRASSSSDSPGV